MCSLSKQLKQKEKKMWCNQTSAGMHFVQSGNNMKIQQPPVFLFNIVQWEDSGPRQDYSGTAPSREKQDKPKHL